jgi:hypothetical protein
MTVSATALPDTWGEVVAAPVGHIFVDRHEDGVRFLIMRGPAALCAYVGIPESHPLAGHSYDDVPLQCHGGLTFAAKGEKMWHAGWYWYGWDYGHAGDRSVYSDLHPLQGFADFERTETRWTPKMVDEDAWDALYGFKKLARLAEKTAVGVRTPADTPDHTEEK